MLYFLDIFGTLIFAISGAFKASRRELDILGALVLATATGVGGGIIRDMVLGATPPAAFHDESYLFVCLAGGVTVIFIAPRIARRWNMVMAADALGLGVFSAIGAAKAAAYGLGPMGTIMMAALTAVGGGVIRDVLVCEVPAVIRTDFYATAAILGGATFVALHACGVGQSWLLFATTITATGLRLLAMRFHLRLPKVRRLDESAIPNERD
ncbi:putative membrane protein YeiH [Desulfobaculum xiamenense]|uniref:Putative membrane protein YeiH n=1 Tax=Desulfobaculum xiamenense TaxID=995050 RepID=A0A846QE09_9BACT|nr:trimeric intracellular cation channel family protein [Desulfobaculum xiamenense]NJB66956.1 putative membrane protein YeiH [Desulfobaculum xiamenense]